MVVISRKQSAVRKATIIQRARSIFWDKGYNGATLKDIARSCGFEAANIYNYFHSKEQVLYEVLLEETSKIVYAMRRLEGDVIASPVEQLRWIIKNHVELALGGRRVSGLLFDVELRNLSPIHRKKIIELRDEYESIMCKVIRAGIGTGDFTEIDEKLACYAIVSIILRTRMWFSSKGRLSSNEIADFIFRFALDGLRNRFSGGKAQYMKPRKGYETKHPKVIGMGER